MAPLRIWLAALFLLLGAANGLIALVADTCTGGAADSLFAGPITFLLNIAGFVLLWGRSTGAVVLAAALPALAALRYSAFAATFLVGHIGEGMTACAAKLGTPFDIVDGSEAGLVAIWVAASLSFWIGLALALWRSRNIEEPHLERSDIG